MELLHKEVTEQIIGAAIEVWKELGYGFLEKVYQKAMKVELELRGIKAETESQIKVYYKRQLVGNYQADLFVNDCVIVELKVADKYNSLDEAQLLNELKATGIKVGLLINFGRHKAEFKRFVY
jgi:GxxExxY protein